MGNFLSLVVEDQVKNSKWMATSVYGSSNYQRKDMFRELSDVRGKWNGAWRASRGKAK